MIKELIKTITVSLITLSLISVAYAWTEPTSNPPSDNVSTPINAGSTYQYKNKSLGLWSSSESTALNIYGPLSGQWTASGINFGATDTGETNYWHLGYRGGLATNEYKNLAAWFYNGSTWVNPLSLTSTGNVGIGTTAPTYKFEVYGDGARSKFTNTNTVNRSNVMVLQNNSSVGYSSLDFYNSSGSQMGFMGYGNSSATNYGDKVYLGSANKNIIINPGTANVGIGTTAPKQKLDVAGSISMGGGTETAANYILGGTSVNNSPFLQLFGSNYSDSTRRGEFTAVSYGSGDIRFYNQPSANVWNERMKITSAGAVTIPGTLGVTGATTLNGGLTATTGSFSSTLGVTGQTILSGNLYVGGNTQISGALAVSSEVTVNGKLKVKGGYNYNASYNIYTNNTATLNHGLGYVPYCMLLRDSSGAFITSVDSIYVKIQSESVTSTGSVRCW